jgi:glycine cleavage system H protein
MYPADRKYTKDHEWVRLSGGEGEIGITDYAQKQLGDVVYIELPELGRRVKQGEVFGTIESVKAVSELFSPASGQIIAVNTTLPERPETVNSDPHGTWMIKLKLDDPSEASSLLDSGQYSSLVK